MPGKGLYANIHAKRKRIASGSGEKMRKPGSKGAPTAANFKRSAKTAKKLNRFNGGCNSLLAMDSQVLKMVLLPATET